MKLYIIDTPVDYVKLVFKKQTTHCLSLSFYDIYLYSLSSVWLSGTCLVIINPYIPLQTVYQYPQSGPDTGHVVCNYTEPEGTFLYKLAALLEVSYMQGHGRLQFLSIHGDGWFVVSLSRCWLTSALLLKWEKKIMLNNAGAIAQPCLTLLVTGKYSEYSPSF